MEPATEAFLREALREPFAAGELRMITLPAPQGRAEALLRLDERGPAVYWADRPGAGGNGTTGPAGSGGAAAAGVGAAHVICATGDGRFDAVRAEADRLWPRIRVLTHPEVRAPAPRLFGGFSFLPGPPAAPWRRFGEATFLLPRLLYRRDDQGASLSVVVTADEATAGGGEVVARRIRRTLELLAGSGRGDEAIDAAAAAPVAVAAETIESMDEDEWSRAVEAIRSRIAEGRAAKVVAARRTVLRLTTPADPALVLSRLEREASAEVRFALRCGRGTLLGATPERLIARRGDAIRTEAIAGSIDVERTAPRAEPVGAVPRGGGGPADPESGDGGSGEAVSGDAVSGDPGSGGGSGNGEAPPAERLLGSAKEAEEHAFVVDAIARALSPLCARLDYPAEPRVQRLRHVLHLQTPFDGRLARPVHVLELVRRLHPTPAVAGTPTAEALEWIAGAEAADRGWYAAPVGWFDAAGDGDFVVALRSGLLRDDLAYLYAGAGIVRDSDAAAEYEETATKLKTMMDALGFTG